MTKLETIIAVKDVVRSSEWYCDLLNLKSNHGGETFEILTNLKGDIVLCLHRWGEHDHPPLKYPYVPIGNGLILYFRVSKLNDYWRNAIHLKLDIEQNPHLNKNSGRNQFTLKDLDGYYIIISE